MSDLQFHDVANIFPYMTDEEFAALKTDIAENGQREPIWLHDGKIIDGRNRYRACVELGIKPKFRLWDEQGSLVQFVLSLNLHRRHLTSSQRAALATEIEPLIAAELEELRRKKISETRVLVHEQMGELLRPSNGDERGPKASEIAAQNLNTNGKYVSDAKTIKKEAPDLFAQVKAGEKSIPEAKRELTARKKVAPPPLPSEKYRVIYADPPWHYGNSGVITESDNYGRAARHYPSMTIPELCTLGSQVREMTEENAVLFMWVTSPLLEESFEVINAWGFKYKTSFVWDKIKHNFGHYNSVRHELLLVCTKGSCTPDVKTLHDSVVSLERSDKHSEKPEQFRQMIDGLYTWGKRIELFSRNSADGWETWGNEPN